ncbi:MAG TPA: hypothetical protein EYP53_06245 [Candidatus Latescibacteria bacterium]|nr:hypothetical protein [Candidatus Latescibacterota bacterium]
MAVVVIDGGTTNTRIMLVQDGKVIGRASGPVGVRDSALDGNNARLKAGMDFRKLPKSHLKIVKRWLGFYQAYKEEIVRGRWPISL